MPKKDTTSAVLGMLSNAGAQTRPAPPEVAEFAPEPLASPSVSAPPVSVEPVHAVRGDRPPATVSQLPPAPAKGKAEVAPRTLRLLPGTAEELRAAWLEAKRDDVLLTAQDFASALVEEGLARRRRSRAASSR